MVIRLSKIVNGPIALKITTNPYFNVKILKINLTSYVEGDEKGDTRVLS